ncbi:hypothetical protein DFS34DRAFT_646903 [Phlyctochytrium arcticum]|nr:hypothetical protein DFS34DRAFT_646903 [Phlyctochytrium arcticum]
MPSHRSDKRSAQAAHLVLQSQTAGLEEDAATPPFSLTRGQPKTKRFPLKRGNLPIASPSPPPFNTRQVDSHKPDQHLLYENFRDDCRDILWEELRSVLQEEFDQILEEKLRHLTKHITQRVSEQVGQAIDGKFAEMRMANQSSLKRKTPTATIRTVARNFLINYMPHYASLEDYSQLTLFGKGRSAVPPLLAYLVELPQDQPAATDLSFLDRIVDYASLTYPAVACFTKKDFYDTIKDIIYKRFTNDKKRQQKQPHQTVTRNLKMPAVPLLPVSDHPMSHMPSAPSRLIPNVPPAPTPLLPNVPPAPTPLTRNVSPALTHLTPIVSPTLTHLTSNVSPVLTHLIPNDKESEAPASPDRRATRKSKVLKPTLYIEEPRSSDSESDTPLAPRKRIHPRAHAEDSQLPQKKLFSAPSSPRSLQHDYCLPAPTSSSSTSSSLDFPHRTNTSRPPSRPTSSLQENASSHANRVANIAAEVQADLARKGKNLPKQASEVSSLKLKHVSDLILDLATTDAADRTLKTGLIKYKDASSVVKYLEKTDGCLSTWPNTLAGLVQLWKLLWTENFSRSSYPPSPKSVIYSIGIIQVGGVIAESIIPLEKIRSTFVVDRGMDVVVDEFDELSDLFQGLLVILNPSAPNDRFKSLCQDLFKNAQKLDYLIYTILDLLCTLMAQPLNLRQYPGRLERVHTNIFDLIYDFNELPNRNALTAHRALTRLIVAGTRPLRPEFSKLLDHWDVTWDGIQLFHQCASYILAGYFGQWDFLSPGVKAGVFGNIEEIFTIPSRKAVRMRRLLDNFPTQSYTTSAWKPLPL